MAEVVENHDGRVYLSRIMYNPDLADTAELSDEDKRKTIISMQGGKTFGRAETNDVVFLDTSEIVEREPQYISRRHACIHHIIGPNYEHYYVEDHSENGTYINDRRLEKNQRELLRVGDTLKFGHKNGSEHVAGIVYPSPEADFAFKAVSVKVGDPCYSLVEEIKNNRVKIFIGSPFVEDIEESVENAENRAEKNRRRGVQQQEADSTNGNDDDVIMDTTGDTSGSDATDILMSTPSLPSSSSMNSTGITPSSTSSPNGIASTSTADTTNRGAPEQWIPSTSQTNVVLPPSCPKRAPRERPFNDPLHFYVFRIGRYSPVYQQSVVAQAVRFAEVYEDSRRFTKLLTSFLDIHVAHVMKKTRAEKLEMIDMFCSLNDRAEYVEEIVSNRETLAQFLLDEEPETDRIRQLLVEIVDDKHPKQLFGDLQVSKDSAFQPHVPKDMWHPEASNPLDSERNYIAWLRWLKKLDPLTEAALDIRLSHPDLQPYTMRELRPYQQRILTTIAFLNEFMKENEASTYETYLDGLSRVLEVSRIHNEEEDGGPKAFKNFTRASLDPAKSDEGEIDEERHSASSGSTAEADHVDVPPAAEVFRPRTDSEVSEIVDVVGTDDEKEEDEIEEKEGGTETDTTPTPSPEGGVIKPTDVADESRNSSTPRIDAQSTSSAVVSALPTPMSSPIPKIASPPQVPIPTTSSKKESDDDKLTAQIKTLPSAESTPVSAAVVPKKKERKNKQLDDSGDESESDDDATTKNDEKKQKKNENKERPVRAAKAVRREKKADGEDGPIDDDATPPRPKAVARRKNLKRAGADGDEVKEKKPRKKKEDVDPDGDDPPKKKRGRKKATPQPQDVVDGAADEPVENEKEKCGVAGKYCLCVQHEKKRNLEWVSCSVCEQWYHVFCVRLHNDRYGEDEVFICCTQNRTEDARQCLAGEVHRNYFTMKRRPVPQSAQSPE